MKIVPGQYQNFTHHQHLQPLASYTQTLTFENYLHVFERFFVEKGILDGTLGTLQDAPFVSPKTPLATALGYNTRNAIRVSAAADFFSKLANQGEERFLQAGVYETQYFHVGNATPHVGRAHRLVQMHKIYQAHQGVVPTLEPRTDGIYYRSDFPWSINYFGYEKQRDGSHRRMIFAALGKQSIPTFVVDVTKISAEELSLAPTFVRTHFDWFCTYIEKLIKNSDFRTQHQVQFNASGNVENGRM